MKNRKKIFVILAAFLTTLLISISFYYFLRNPGANNVDAVERLVGRHYVLPNEEPALATVEDKTKLNSDFLRSAENGDKLLIYQKSKKVILYRPGIDRIIEVGPISIADTTGTSGQ